MGGGARGESALCKNYLVGKRACKKDARYARESALCSILGETQL
jgi:hypothetical protein